MAAHVDILRLYDSLDHSHGQGSGQSAYRVFIDRLWPRGVAKGDFHYDAWCKDLAPTPDLRKWFGHKTKNWTVFRDRYRAELRTKTQQERIQNLLDSADGKPVVLLYGAKDPQHNHAVILAEEIEHALEQR